MNDLILLRNTIEDALEKLLIGIEGKKIA